MAVRNKPSDLTRGVDVMHFCALLATKLVDGCFDRWDVKGGCLPPAFAVVSTLAHCSALKMEAIRSSEMSVDFQQTTRRCIFRRMSA
jgi:hypothetical protein